MNFGEKLVLLRKKKGFSQEDLAEKLGVSRQSVSKWESGNTYPETDKIIQICNLFECSMDDLINDKINDIEQIERANKTGLNEAWDSLLDFIVKTINMFSRMTFLSGIKCLFEMFFVSLMLLFFGFVLSHFAGSVISHLFSFLPGNAMDGIYQFLTNLFYFVWSILSIIVLIHVFKLRYLNYYDQYTINQTKEEQKGSSNVDDNLDFKKQNKIIIRDDEHQPFAFLGILSKGIIVFMKLFVFWIGLMLSFGIFGLVIADFLTIVLIPNHLLFVGLSIFFLSFTVIAIIFLLLCIFFLFSKKVPFRALCIMFFVALVFSGIGTGISVVSFKNIEFVESADAKSFKNEEVSISYQDDLAIVAHGNNRYQYIIDSSIEENSILITDTINPTYELLHTYKNEEDMMSVFYLAHNSNFQFKNIYHDFISNLKKNRIVINQDSSSPVVIRGNEETISKLIYNLEKLYLIEKNQNDNTISVVLKNSKVYFPYGIEGKYDARNDTLIFEREGDSCNRSVESTEYGEKIIYTCSNQEDLS